MVRSGKEHAALSLAPAAIADDATTQDTRWLNGVNRQLRPDAASQRQAASAAAAAKHKAMTGEEKAAAERRRSDRRNEGKRARRAEAKEATAAAAAAAAEDESDSEAMAREQPDIDELNDMLEEDGHEPIDEEEYDAFRDWCDRHDLDAHEETYTDWCADQDGGGKFHAERQIDAWSRAEPEDDSAPEEHSAEIACHNTRELAAAAPPPPPPPPPASSVAVEPEPEPDPLSYLHPRVDDWQPCGGDWEPPGWGSPPSDDGSNGAEEAERLPPDAVLQRMPLTARAAYHYGHLFTGEELLDAHVANMPAGEAAHHRALAPAVIEGHDGQVVMQAFDPEGEIPYYYDPAAGRPDYGAVRVSYGDRDAFYSWLEGSPDHAPLPSLSTRPLSPAPYREQFASAKDFHDEQARWFRDHGDGSELRGTRHERNHLFDRLRDKLHGNRRARANPSGTRRNATQSGM